MTRYLAVLLIVLAISMRADADAPCRPAIPDDLRLLCVDGVVTAVSESAGEYMPFPNWRCQKGQST